MKKIKLLLLSVILAGGINEVRGGGSTTYYSKLNVSASPSDAAGKVYVSTTTTKSDKQFAEQNSSNSTHTYYLWADAESGYIFKGWKDNNTAKYVSGNFSCGDVSVTTSKTNQNDPEVYNYVGEFEEYSGNLQITNSDFETWDNVTGSNAPYNWNSFETAEGSWASTVSAQQVEKSTDKCPGSKGNYSARIYSRDVIFAIAQGNLTTGCINAGATTATAANNYNFSKITDVLKSERISAIPDYLTVWVKYTVENKDNSHPYARIAATVHDAHNYITYGLPANDTDDNRAYSVATAECNYTTTYAIDTNTPNAEVIETNGGWAHLKVPFILTNESYNPEYILVNISTNSYPGGGKAGDNVYVDDLVLGYNDAKVTTGASGYATLVYKNPLDFTGVTGLTAYVATADNGSSVNLTEVTKIPANTPVIVKGEANTTYSIPVALADNVDNNLLAGSAFASHTVTSSEKAYVLNTTDGILYPASEGIIDAGIAYLVSNTGDASKTLSTAVLVTTEFSDNLDVTINGEVNETRKNMVATLYGDITDYAASPFTFTLKNVYCTLSGNTYPVGNVVVDNVEVASDGTFNYSGEIVIQNGDGGDQWVGPSFGTFAITLDGKVDGDTFLFASVTLTNTQFTINMKYGLSSSATYSEDLYVTVNDVTTGPQTANVVVETQGNGDINFNLKNFVLGTIYVGNITINSLKVSESKFKYTGNISITKGDTPSNASWIGPNLGKIPLDLKGEFVSEKYILVSIDIDMTETDLKQMIYVHLGYDRAVLSVSDAKYGTFAAPVDITLPEGVTAYKVTSVDNNTGVLELTKAADENQTLEAGTAVVVASESPASSEAYFYTTEESTTTNYLTGVYKATTAPVGSYVLQNLNNEVAFYQVATGQQPTVGANRCYLTTTVNVKALAFPDGTMTSISEIQAADEKAVIYDLSGRRVSKATKGIYIINGKKVIK